MYISRKLERLLAGSKKSILLLGPRQTGKSTLIRRLKPELTLNLADEETFVSFLKDPGLLRRRIGSSKYIFIDEIQRIPSLLNTAQALIDEDKTKRFYLTGSSARKLKRGKANLLPGRVLVHRLGPLSPSEIGKNFNLERALSVGLLPEPYLNKNEKDSEKLLRSYAITYLKEEIQAEALTRNLEGFSRFFEIAASRNGDFIDFSKFASQASIERTSAQRYFEILCDTLIVEPVVPFTKSARRRLIQHPKYYFFDVGVLNGALGNFLPSLDRKGPLFETLFLQCVLSELSGRDQDYRVSVYRTEAGAEVDFIFEIGKRIVAVEVKATRNIGTKDLRGLRSFREFFGKSRERIIAYLGEYPQHFEDDVMALPFLDAIRAVSGAF
ncbi:MAG: ATP-binding protein [Deltaproteobacteria bacterium]|nr:ATP-binding protein [Deltaproteobacteria bacterium]